MGECKHGYKQLVGLYLQDTSDRHNQGRKRDPHGRNSRNRAAHFRQLDHTVFFVGFTFQVLVTGYTAVVTTKLISSDATEVRSFEEAIDKGFRFCVNDAMIPTLVNKYEGLAPLLVPIIGSRRSIVLYDDR